MSAIDPTGYTASDVPKLRRDLTDWYGGPQGDWLYRAAILAGKQPVRPSGPPAAVARHLAAAESARLRDADLWYVDADLCALLAAAHPTMPPFAPRPQDLPSRTGFAVFAEPIALYLGGESRVDHVFDTSRSEVAQRLYAEDVRIMAVSWGPIEQPSWTAGGVWMSFYSPSNIGNDGVTDEKTARQVRALLPPLTIDNEFVTGWRPDGEPVDRFLLHGGEGQKGTAAWGRLVFAAFQLAAQANLAETEEIRTPRPERRRTERAGLPARDVRVVRLRRGLVSPAGSDQTAGTGREYRHRWVVRGYWRNTWYPSLTDHRPQWIAPHVKGPEGKPLIGGDKVTHVSAPPADPPQPS